MFALFEHVALQMAMVSMVETQTNILQREVFLVERLDGPEPGPPIEFGFEAGDSLRKHRC